MPKPVAGGPFESCPLCGIIGQLVHERTLRSLIKPAEQDRIGAGRYHFFCHGPRCPVVYYAVDGSHVFTTADLTVKVGVKEYESPRPVCYCFGYTAEEISAEIQRTGSSQVLVEIRSRMDGPGCDCVHTNPQGSCCLGAVVACVEEAMKRCPQGSGSPPSGASS